MVRATVPGHTRDGLMRRAWMLASLAACAVPDDGALTAVPAAALVGPPRGAPTSRDTPTEDVSADEGIRVRVDAACAGDVLYALSAGGRTTWGRAPSGTEAGLRWPGPDERATLRYGCDHDGDGIVSGSALVTQPVAWRIDRARPLVLALPRPDTLDAMVAPATPTPP